MCSQNKPQENEVCCSALNRNSAFNMGLNYSSFFIPSPNLQNGVDITIIRPPSGDWKIKWYRWSPWDGARHTARFSANVCWYCCWFFSTKTLNRWMTVDTNQCCISALNIASLSSFWFNRFGLCVTCSRSLQVNYKSCFKIVFILYNCISGAVLNISLYGFILLLRLLLLL